MVSYKMNWFQKHLNWTLVIVVLAAWLLFGCGVSIASGTWLATIMFFLWVGITLGVSAWVLREKGRSLWNLLWLGLGYVPGIIIFMCMENKKAAMGFLG